MKDSFGEDKKEQLKKDEKKKTEINKCVITSRT